MMIEIPVDTVLLILSGLLVLGGAISVGLLMLKVLLDQIDLDELERG